MKKILIIQTSSASKLMLDTALFRCLKQQLQAESVHLVTDAAFKHLIENNPNIDQFYYYNNNLKSLLADFHLHGFDLVIDLQNDFTSHQLVADLEVERLHAKEKSLLQKLLHGFGASSDRITQDFEIVRSMNIQFDGKGVDFFIPAENQVLPQDIPTSHAAGYIAILLNQNVSVSDLKKVCEKINHPILLLGTDSDKEAGEIVAALDSIKIYNAAGKFNFFETADLIRNAKLLISEVNEYLFIAASFHVKTIALFKHKKEFVDIPNAYNRSAMANSKGPVYLWDSKLLKKQRPQALIQTIQRALYQ